LKPRNDARTTPPAETGAGMNPLQWVAARFAELRSPKPLPPLRLPRRPALRAPRRGTLAAMWEARLAARAGVPVDEYLQHRLSRQLAALPLAPSRLPATVAVEPDGTLAVRPAPPASARRAPWLDSFLRAHGHAALAPDIQLAQADVARLAARIESQRQRVDAASRALEGVIQTKEVADPEDEAQAQQMGRPPVPPPVGLALRVLGLALLAAETWQLGVPCLEVAGIRTDDLAAELHRNPLGLVLGALFALGAAASLFLFAYVAHRRALELFDGLPEPRRRGWTAAAAVGATAISAAIAWSIAGVRPGAHHPLDVRAARVATFLVALAIPATVAWLVSVAGAHDAARDEALALARAWDQEHYRSLADVTRHAASLSEEERRLDRLEADRAAAVRRLRTLQQRAAAAERLAADAADAEEADLARVVQAIVSSLELDRYEFARQGGARAMARGEDAPPATSNDVTRNLGLTA
jgi:hypothetical protein